MILYLEDLKPGDKLTTAIAEVTEAASIAFAKQFDPQPMHTDPEAAAAGPFGGLIASGWYTAAIVMRLMTEARPIGDGPVLGVGVDELRWPTPLRPGDTVQAVIEVAGITPSRSHPDHGVVHLAVTARNQLGKTVMTMRPNLWVPRGPAA